MSEIAIQRSLTNSAADETTRERHDQVVFEDVADQYVKGQDITAHFTILNDTKVDASEHQIGLLRVGCTNVQECVAYAPAQFTSSGSTRHGTAVFPSSSLPDTDEEFYQFCYLANKRKCLGSSIPFQLNCSTDDIDLLSSTVGHAALERSSLKSNNDGLIAFADHDNDDLVVIHSKSMLLEEKLRQENRYLLEVNRRLEQQKDESKAKFELLNHKSEECIKKVKNDLQVLAATHKTTIDELSARQHLEANFRAEHDACLALCEQYKAESLKFAERCRHLNDSNTQLAGETAKLRAQLSAGIQLTNAQLAQIEDLEKRMLQSSELLKTANQAQLQLEQQLRDLRITSEKHQMSVQAQISAFVKQIAQQDNQINALQSAKGLLKEELDSVTADNQFLLARSKEDKQLIKDLQEEIAAMDQEHQTQDEQNEKELEKLRQELEQSQGTSSDFMVLKNSFNEIEKRCVKHQKSEIEVKKQLSIYKEFIAELQNKNQELTDRLSAGADEYKALYRKHAALERMVMKGNRQGDLSAPKSNPTTLSNETGLNEEALVTLLRTSYELQQQDQQHKAREEEEDEEEQEKDAEEEEEEEDVEEQDEEIRTTTVPQVSTATEEIRECPMCFWDFPQHLTLENKKEHIENHFA